jgi:hypothetical protein
VLLVYASIEFVVSRLLYLHGCVLTFKQLSEAKHCVVDLALGMKDGAAAMGQIGIWPIHDEEIREARNGYAKVSAGVIIAPQFIQTASLASDYRHRAERRVRLKSRCKNYDIRRMLDPIVSDYASGLNSIDLLGDQ